VQARRRRSTEGPISNAQVAPYSAPTLKAK